MDAIDAEANAFYERYGFISLPAQDFHLYLTVDTIRILFGAQKR